MKLGLIVKGVGMRLSNILSKIEELQAKLENHDELTHKLEFLQSQMEEMDNEKDVMKAELEKALEDNKIQAKEDEILQQTEKKLEENTSEMLKIKEEKQKL